MTVIPADAGISCWGLKNKIPASAGMTKGAGKSKGVGMTVMIYNEITAGVYTPEAYLPCTRCGAESART